MCTTLLLYCCIYSDGHRMVWTSICDFDRRGPTLDTVFVHLRFRCIVVTTYHNIVLHITPNSSFMTQQSLIATYFMKCDIQALVNKLFYLISAIVTFFMIMIYSREPLYFVNKSKYLCWEWNSCYRTRPNTSLIPMSHHSIGQSRTGNVRNSALGV